jgi:hypothetical protein
MKTKDKIALILIVLVSLGTFPTFFGKQKITYKSPFKRHWEITLEGYFTKTGSVKPGEILFSYYGKHKRTPDKINYFSDYKYLGKTGENTFELEHSERGSVVEKESKEIIKLFFFENRAVHLHTFRSLYTSCTTEDKVYLQMDALKGDKLEYRIILPPCLERATPPKPATPEEQLQQKRREREDEIPILKF